jgi:hypothetical protein
LDNILKGLLRIAGEFRERLNEEAEFNAIPVDERERIYRDIEIAVASKKGVIQEESFNFTPVKKDFILPLVINVSIFLLIAALSLFFFSYFKQAETHIIAKSGSLTNSESRLFKALIEESEKKIENINALLAGMQKDQAKILSESKLKAIEIEQNLRQTYQLSKENELKTLQNGGFPSEVIEEKLREFDSLQQKKFRDQLTLALREVENQRISQEQTLKNTMDENKRKLEEARKEQFLIEEKLDFSINEKRSAAVELAFIEEQEKTEQAVLSQILALYRYIEDSIEKLDYEKANLTLDNLEDYLNKDEVKTLPSLLDRRRIDLFIIQSLRTLIDFEPVQEGPVFRTKNGLYSSESIQSAMDLYLPVFSNNPESAIENSSINAMDLLKMQERKDLFRQTVNRGDQYLRDKNFQTAIIQYQKALEYLENDPVVVHSIITNLMEIQSQMEAPEKEELINQLKSQEAAKKQILQELERIEKEYKEINPVSVEERSTDLMNNLNTKLTIKEVLASESIKEQYPDLSHKLDLYLEAYSREIEKKQQDQFLLFLQKFKENIF